MSTSTTPAWQRLVLVIIQLAVFFLLLNVHVLAFEAMASFVPAFNYFRSDIAELLYTWCGGLVAVLSSAYWLDFFQKRLGWASLGFTSQRLAYGLRTGFWVGGGIILFSFLGLLLGPWVDVVVVNFQPKLLLAWFIFFLIQPLAEEVVMRSVIQTQVQRYFGASAGLWVTALIFGAIHINNDSFNWLAGLNIVLGGYLMGQLYLRAKNIWAPFAMHASWNFLQSTVLGFAVSGMDTYTLLQLKIEGPSWLTGGNFGLEGSIVTGILLVLAIYYFWER